MSFLPKFPQEGILQGFNVVISTEHRRNVNYDRSSEAVITDWRTTASLGVMSLYSSRNNVKKNSQNKLHLTHLMIYCNFTQIFS